MRMTKERRDCYYHEGCEPDFDLGYCNLHDKIIGKDGFWCDDCPDVRVFDKKLSAWVKENNSEK